MFTVSVSNVKKRANVGLFPQELKTGNELIFNLSVSVPSAINSLPDIDYGILYQIIDDAINEPTQLLESILQKIVLQLQKHFPEATLKVSITKVQPPLEGMQGNATVSWEG